MSGAGIVLQPIRPGFEMLYVQGVIDNSLEFFNPFCIASLRHSQQSNVGQLE